jgi:hypothetical protein
MVAWDELNLNKLHEIADACLTFVASARDLERCLAWLWGTQQDLPSTDQRKPLKHEQMNSCLSFWPNHLAVTLKTRMEL